MVPVDDSSVVVAAPLVKAISKVAITFSKVSAKTRTAKIEVTNWRMMIGHESQKYGTEKNLGKTVSVLSRVGAGIEMLIGGSLENSFIAL